MGFNKAFEDRKFMIFYVRKLSNSYFKKLHTKIELIFSDICRKASLYFRYKILYFKSLKKYQMSENKCFNYKLFLLFSLNCYNG